MFKKYIFACILALVSIIEFGGSCMAVSDEAVTDRELLLLSIISYYNVQNNDTSTMPIVDDKYMDDFKQMYSSSELNGWETKDYTIEESVGSRYGFSAVTYKKNNNVVVAFRGTDSGLFLENKWYLCPFIEHPQAKFASEYMDKILNSNFVNENTKIYLTGHSLGGYLVLNTLGKFYEKENFKSKFVRAVTFNGLGIGYMEDKKIHRVLSKLSDDQLVNYRMEWDIVSLIGKHFTKVLTLKTGTSVPNSIMQILKKMKSSHALYNFLAFKLKHA